MRLDKFLSECGFGTRSEIKKLIRTDRVSVVGAKSKPTADMRIDENTAEVSGKLGDSEVSAFAEGMDLGDFIAQPSEMTIVSSDDDKSAAEVTIYEGKFHQIKRMFEKTGHTVTYLKRTAMNRLSLDESLGEGELRELTDRELELLIYES